MNSPVILVVEDNPMVRELITVTLDLDYQVLTARTGEEAMHTLRLCLPDMVLLDLGLGEGMSGLEVCRLIRTNWITRDLPILVLSVDREQGKEAAMAVGANGFIHKPYSPAYLLCRVRSLLAKDEVMT